MQTPIDLAVGTCAISIAYVYPFVAVWRGKPVKDAALTSWVMQICYFTVLCLGVPALGSFYSHELGNEMAQLMPDAPILVPIFVSGWLMPWLVGSIAWSIRPSSREQDAEPKSL